MDNLLQNNSNNLCKRLQEYCLDGMLEKSLEKSVEKVPEEASRGIPGRFCGIISEGAIIVRVYGGILGGFLLKWYKNDWTKLSIGTLRKNFVGFSRINIE